MSKKEKPFEIQTNGHTLALLPGMAVANLFRKNCEVDYLMVDLDHFPEVGEGILRIFNNEDLVHWMAGLAFRETVRGNFKPEFPEFGGKSFRERAGWNLTTIIREEPSEEEKQWYTEVMTDGFDNEWANFNEGEDDGA